MFDASNYGRNVNQNSTDALPTFLNKDLNYNPSLKFGYPSSTKLVGDYFVEPSKSYYVFYVANQSNKLANGKASNSSLE